MATKVAIIGGGVAGLSAAHELIKRGFDVDIYEKRAEVSGTKVVGGKARSFDVPGTGPAAGLPSEHGFRFFPGFYKHLPATMKEIFDGKENVYARLTTTTETLLARSGGKQNILTPNHFPNSLATLIQAFKGFNLFYCDLGIAKSEVAYFINRLLTMLVSCEKRRYEHYEGISWYDFSGAASMSKSYRDYLVTGMSRSLVALNAEDLSCRTGVCILLQFLMDFTGSTPVDRVLDRPTNEAWLDPWRDQLLAAGVNIHNDHELDSFVTAGGQVSGVQLNTSAGSVTVTANYYVAAVPVEKLQPKLGPLVALDSQLASIHKLNVSWMTGIVFFLNKDVPINHGHGNFLDSSWALTSISQAQFWPSIDLNLMSSGSVKGILSVIVSNWGPPLFGGKSASDCDPSQLMKGVWDSLKDHLNSSSSTVLADSDLVHVELAEGLTHTATGWSNEEPLFINTIGSWFARPTASTAIGNFFLAADFVQTHTDLASMESANEAARRAVNGILGAESFSGSKCEIWPLDEPPLLVGYRKMDEFRYFLGLDPLVPPVPLLPWPC